MSAMYIHLDANNMCYLLIILRLRSRVTIQRPPMGVAESERVLFESQFISIGQAQPYSKRPIVGRKTRNEALEPH